MEKDKGKKFIFIASEDTLDNTPIREAKEGIVYVVSSWGVVQFKCPCGCGDLITLDIIGNEHPYWRIKGKDSITPSINRQVGCRSHFTITNGITH